MGSRGRAPCGCGGASCYGTRASPGCVSKCWESVKSQEKGFLPTEQHPGYSPDLNPIENAFAGAERELSKLLANRPAKNVGETLKYFKKALKTVADSGEILKAAQSMPRRLKAVLDANGQATKY